jgi:hypothetical protein
MYPIATLPITNLTWTGMGLNSGFCGEMLATNRPHSLLIFTHYHPLNYPFTALDMETWYN